MTLHKSSKKSQYIFNKVVGKGSRATRRMFKIKPLVAWRKGEMGEVRKRISNSN